MIHRNPAVPSAAATMRNLAAAKEAARVAMQRTGASLDRTGEVLSAASQLSQATGHSLQDAVAAMGRAMELSIRPQSPDDMERYSRVFNEAVLPVPIMPGPRPGPNQRTRDEQAAIAMFDRGELTFEQLNEFLATPLPRADTEARARRPAAEAHADGLSHAPSHGGIMNPSIIGFPYDLMIHEAAHGSPYIASTTARQEGRRIAQQAQTAQPAPAPPPVIPRDFSRPKRKVELE